MQEQKIDCLFIHVPEYNPRKGPFVMAMAMGIFALADYLQRKGYNTEIIHLGVEKIVNNKYSIKKYLRDKNVCLIGISLQWHHQSRDCINLTAYIKSFYPRVKIVLGGFTASYFADEIMKRFKDIDFIIRGDGEIPLLGLVKEVSKQKPNYFLVPNLIWRNNNKIITNVQKYTANEEDINKLNFSNLNLLKNYSTYLVTPIRMPNYSREYLCNTKGFYLCTGRGCSVNCVFCGGSRISQKTINNRDRTVFRSAKRVLATIKELSEFGIDCLHISFDPSPDKKYYIDLFSLIRKNKINISMVFECWSIPALEFIDEFEKTFGKGKYSRIVLSPETGSDRLRRLIKGFYYSNNELLKVLPYLKSKKIFTDIYFSYPLPFESIGDKEETKDFVELIKKEIKNNGRVLIQDYGFDPGSPMFLNPERYGITKKSKLFIDYCRKKEYFRKTKQYA